MLHAAPACREARARNPSHPARLAARRSGAHAAVVWPALFQSRCGPLTPAAAPNPTFCPPFFGHAPAAFPAVRCNSVYGVGGSADQWAPSSTPLHCAAAGGRARVVHAILQAAAERQRSEPRSPDIRMLQDFRGGWGHVGREVG